MLAPRRDIQTKVKVDSSSDQSRGAFKRYRNKTCKKTRIVMAAMRTPAKYFVHWLRTFENRPRASIIILTVPILA
jgi:hypothetical protein